ncbi:unnamed protein product [Cylindrotheca closterium]|uniref:Uncharacterized protein n=1 Tax=Cylindrotheca closterium TaxID=2856 RepID=A0AAD2CP51_9STRA|nr:unnamed protein product [Cylindrotheca closterium]
MAANIGGVTYEVDFKPNTAILAYPSESSSITVSSLGDTIVGDVQKKKQKGRSFGFSLPSKLKKKFTSRTNKKIKGKAKMASLKSAAAAASEPSKNLIRKWNSTSSWNYEPLESSGSLFAGRLEDDNVNINSLPTVPEESSERLQPQESSSSSSSFRLNKNKTTQNEVVQENIPKKKWKRLKRLLTKFKNHKSSQSSVADTASTTSSPSPPPRVESLDAALRDDTEVALASADDTFFSIPPETTTCLPSHKTPLPPSLTLVRPSSVARQASAANFVNMMPQEVEYPSDEEDSSVDSIVSPVPCGSPPRTKKILNYKKNVKVANNKKKTKAPVVVAKSSTATTTATVVALRRWNVWALLLVAVLCALSVWQAWFALPREAVSEPVISLVSSGANISYVGECYYYKVDGRDEWPWDEYEARSVYSTMFDENGVLDCSFHF